MFEKKRDSCQIRGLNESILLQPVQTVLFNLQAAFLLIVEEQQNSVQSVQDDVWSIQKMFGDAHLN